MVQLSLKNTLLLIVAGCILMTSAAYAVPVDDIDEADEEIKRSMLWSRLVGGPQRMAFRSRLFEERGAPEPSGLESQSFSHQKRYRPAMQSRSVGGRGLCALGPCH